MNSYLVSVVGYLLLLNVITFIIYGVDKYKAKRNKWRIPETTLLMLAAVGGSIGAWMAMRVFHHKTLHNAGPNHREIRRHILEGNPVGL